MASNNFRSAEQLIRDSVLVKHYAGSIAYGTNLPTSDVDFRGIFCADPINIRTPFFNIREVTDTSEEDTKLYELTKFVQLCTECNPNIIETLWVDNSDVVFRTPAYDYLRENRLLMLSSKIAFTTSGYAISQLKRIKGHNKWLNNPQPKEPPRQTNFVKLVHNFSDYKMFHLDITNFHHDYRLVPYGANVFGLYEAKGYQTFSHDYTLNTTFDPNEEKDFFTRQLRWIDHVNKVLMGKHFSRSRKPVAIVKFCKDEYNLAKEKHKQYWTWKQNRNEKRGSLEEQFGFDTKHAMHLVRLLRMGIEALRDNEIIVKRPDAQELLNIRNGAWTYEELVQYADGMDNEIRNVWYKKTALPKKPNLKAVAKLLMDVQDIVWEENK